MCKHSKDREEGGIVRVIVIALAVIGLLTAAAAAANVIIKKYKKYLASLNEDDTLDSLGDDCFEDENEEEAPELDCDFTE